MRLDFKFPKPRIIFFKVKKENGEKCGQKNKPGYEHGENDRNLSEHVCEAVSLRSKTSKSFIRILSFLD